MARKTWTQKVNEYITTHNLDIASVTTEEVNKALYNRLRNLDINTDRRWRKDNDEHGRIVLILAAICVIRDYPGLELDHHEPKFLGGTNSHTNIYPLTSPLNRAKKANPWTVEDLKHYISNADDVTKRMFEFPEGYTDYLPCEEWLMKHYG